MSVVLWGARSGDVQYRSMEDKARFLKLSVGDTSRLRAGLALEVVRTGELVDAVVVMPGASIAIARNVEGEAESQ